VRILIVSTYFPPHVGGVEVVAQRQAELLGRAGHDVVVATSLLDRGHPAEEECDGYRVRRLPASHAIERRFGIPYPVIGPAYWAGLRALVHWSDVVHLHDVLYQPPQAAALLATRAGRPVYATQHVGPVNSAHPVVRRIEGAVGVVAGRYIWRRASRVVSYNPMVHAHLRSHGVPAHRIVRSAIGVDTRAFAPGPAGGIRAELGLPDRPLVLFVGRLVDKKGYRRLVDAADPAYHVVLAGPGRPAEPLPPGVTATGALPRERLTALYRAAAVFALPSSGEVFPIAAQEALACGLPAVLTDSPRYAPYGVDRRLLRLVRPAPDVLRAALTDIVGDPVLRARMGAYSRQLAETHFDAAAGVRALTTLYDREVPCSSRSSS
jgi:glycosyltransferase involved in cell wall biosynthesis